MRYRKEADVSRQNCKNQRTAQKEEPKAEQKPAWKGESKAEQKPAWKEESKAEQKVTWTEAQKAIQETAAGPEIKMEKKSARKREKRNNAQAGRRERRGAGRAALCGMMIALAFLLSYVETLIPISLGVPGVKLGLANLVTIVGLYLVELPQLIFISLVRIVLTGFTFGNGFSMVYGLAGGALSLLVMLAVRRTGWFSQTGVSIAGGVGHNVGQLIVAALVVENTAVFYYLPALLAAGSAAGAVIGLLGGIVTERVQKTAGRI